MSVLVTADIYSGRENPSWRLDDQEGTSVVECLSTASVTGTVPEGDGGGLGFRAFLISNLPASVDLADARVTKSAVEATRPGGEKVTLGGCNRLYELLRTSAQNHLGPADASAIPKG